MKRNHTSGPGNLTGILFSISIGIALFLVNIGSTGAHRAQGSPILFNADRIKVQQIYTSQIGVREKGTNAGPDVEKYLHYVNLSKGNPWCAAFVCWVFGQAGVENPKTGWSPALFPLKRIIWNRQRIPQFTAPSQKSPQTGDLFGLYFAEKKRIAHVGFIDSWDGTWMISVEGNTNASGSREGDGVYRKRRLVGTVYKVARYIGLRERRYQK